MKKIWICTALVCAAFAMAGCGIAEQANGLKDAVGGWVQGEEKETKEDTVPTESIPAESVPTENSSASEEGEDPDPESKPASEGGPIQAPDPIEGGTDQEGSGLTVTLDRIVGATLIFKIENQSDVSYDSVQFAWLFREQEQGVFADENGLPQMVNASFEVPAYSSVYELVPVPDYTILNGDSKQENPNDVFYYNWLNSESDVQDIRVVGWEVSDTPLQDASDWVAAEADPDSGSGRLGYVWNQSDTPIRFQAAVIYNGSEAGLTESTDYLPPAGVIMEGGGGERPQYTGEEGDAKAILYAGEYLAPARKDQMTASEIGAAGEALYQPDSSAFADCEILITRAYFERN